MEPILFAAPVAVLVVAVIFIVVRWFIAQQRLTPQQRLNPVLTSGDHGSVINHQPEQTIGGLLNEEANSLLQYFRKLMMNAQEEGFPELRLVQDAENVWLDLKKRFGDQLPEPQAALALDGSLMFTWRRPGHYLEIEVFPDGYKEAFYENEIMALSPPTYFLFLPKRNESLRTGCLFGKNPLPLRNRQRDGNQQEPSSGDQNDRARHSSDKN